MEKSTLPNDYGKQNLYQSFEDKAANETHGFRIVNFILHICKCWAKT